MLLIPSLQDNPLLAMAASKVLLISALLLLATPSNSQECQGQPVYMNVCNRLMYDIMGASLRSCSVTASTLKKVPLKKSMALGGAPSLERKKFLRGLRGTLFGEGAF